MYLRRNEEERYRETPQSNGAAKVGQRLKNKNREREMYARCVLCAPGQSPRGECRAPAGSTPRVRTSSSIGCQAAPAPADSPGLPRGEFPSAIQFHSLERAKEKKKQKEEQFTLPRNGQVPAAVVEVRRRPADDLLSRVVQLSEIDIILKFNQNKDINRRISLQGTFRMYPSAVLQVRSETT